MPHTQKKGTPVPAVSVASDGVKQSLFARIGQKVARKFGSLEMIAYFCCAVHTKGDTLANKAGIFIPVYIGSILPCRCLMARLPFVGVQQRVGVEPFYLHIVKLS